MLDGRLGLEPHSFHFLEAETQPLLSLLRIKPEVPGTATIVTIVFLGYREQTDELRRMARGATAAPSCSRTIPVKTYAIHNPRKLLSGYSLGNCLSLHWTLVLTLMNLLQTHGQEPFTGIGLTKAISACGEGSLPFSHRKCGLPGDYELMYLEQC